MTRTRLDALLKKFSKTRILVLGDLILDEYLWGKVDRISPEAPVPVVWVERESAMPGGAANVAANIRTLGGQVRLLGAVGQDAGGLRLRRALEAQQIPAYDLITDPGRPTTGKTRVIAHHQQVVRIDREKVHPVSGLTQKVLMERFKRILPQIDGIVVEDYGKGLITPQLLKAVIQLAKRNRKVITVDPKEEHFSSYRGVTALTPNKKEAALAARCRITDDKSLKEAGARILKRLKPQALLMTLGEDGMCLFPGAGKRMVKIPTVAQEVFDVSGAGDTVIAVFTLVRAAGASFLDAARVANAAAGVVVGKVGTALCAPQELRQQMVGR